jgi:8-oxo-dGTP pyrophosphatase MutT (NUDIX family)
LNGIDAVLRAGMRVAYRLQLAWWSVRRPRIEGAYVAVWHGERLLVIKNSYRTHYSLPAGGLRRGETPLDAAVRELAEEVGIAAAPGELRWYGEIVDDAGPAEDHAHVFEVRRDERPDLRIDRREVVWADFLTPREALDRGVVRVVRQYLQRVVGEGSQGTPGASLRR